MTWRDEAIAIIGRVHDALPADADLKARRKALRAARPYHFAATSHGKKVWGKAARQYLERHGQKPDYGRAGVLPTTPLELMIERSKRRADVQAYDAEAIAAALERTIEE